MSYEDKVIGDPTDLEAKMKARSLRMAKDVLLAIGQVVTGGRADKQEAARRYAICQGCPSFISSTQRCSKCGCYMDVKTTIAKATCPVGNW